MTQKNYTPLNIKQKISRPKEGDLPRPAEAITIQEAVEHEKVDEEVRHHIEVRKETIKLPENLKKIGLKEVSATKYKDYKNIKIPLSDDQVLSGQNAPITSSLRWLAVFTLYLLKKAHLTLKVIHGKAVRVISR